MFGHKTKLNKFQNGVKLEINRGRKTGTFTNMRKLNTLLTNEITREIRTYPERNKNENTTYQKLKRFIKIGTKKEIYRHKC